MIDNNYLIFTNAQMENENIQESQDNGIDFTLDPSDYFEDNIPNNNNTSETDTYLPENIYRKKELNQSDTFFNFVSVGDFDCKKETRDTVQNIINLDPVYVLGLGDYSYHKNADCWFEIVEPIRDRIKATMGNHESESSSKLADYIGYFNLTKQYYSFEYRNIHFLSLSTEIPYDSRSSQYQFVANDLEQAFHNLEIDWIIVFFHRQMYGSGATPDDEIEFRDTYHSLFDSFGVDLVIQAHQHIYERIYPITYNQEDSEEPIIKDLNTIYYLDPQAPLFLTVGTGGASPTRIGDNEHFSVITISDYGVLNINIYENERRLDGRFITNGGSTEDFFTIKK